MNNISTLLQSHCKGNYSIETSAVRSNELSAVVIVLNTPWQLGVPILQCWLTANPPA